MAVDITGQKFGKLTAIQIAGKSKDGRSMWECRCSCGNTSIVLGKSLRSGRTKSCGCLQRETVGNMRRTHGQSHSRLHGVYQSVLSRCYNPHAKSYKNYGGRGISVCEEWRNSFSAFSEWAHNSGYLPDAKRNECTLDRINPNGNYEPSNCRWVDQSEQCNNKRNNRLIVFNGETMTVSRFSKTTGIDYFTAYNNIVRRGTSAEELCGAIGCDYFNHDTKN